MGVRANLMFMRGKEQQILALGAQCTKGNKNISISLIRAENIYSPLSLCQPNIPLAFQ